MTEREWGIAISGIAFLLTGAFVKRKDGRLLWWQRSVPVYHTVLWTLMVVLNYYLISDWCRFPNGAKAFLFDAQVYHRAGNGMIAGLTDRSADFFYGEPIRWGFILLSILPWDIYAILWAVLVYAALLDMVRRVTRHPLGWLAAFLAVYAYRLNIHTANIGILLAWLCCVPAASFIAPLVKPYLYPLALLSAIRGYHALGHQRADAVPARAPKPARDLSHAPGVPATTGAVPSASRLNHTQERG